VHLLSYAWSLVTDMVPLLPTLGAAAAAETASAYYRYGAALLYSVQDSADVFGDDMQTAAQQHDVQARATGPSGAARVAQSGRGVTVRETRSSRRV